MGRGGPPPPPPPMAGGGSGRGALLDQIHQGATLKKVTRNERRSSSSDGRSGLLSDIRTGVQLKKVSTVYTQWSLYRQSTNLVLSLYSVTVFLTMTLLYATPSLYCRYLK